MKSPSPVPEILRIAVPIFAGFLVGQVQQITDQAFLGNASAAYLSAVGNASSTIWTTLSILFAFGTGSAILVSQKIGEKKTEEAEAYVGSTALWSTVVALAVFAVWSLANRRIFTAMGLAEPILGYAVVYVRVYSFGILLSGISSAAQSIYNGTGYTKPVMVSSMLRALINIVLDWVLIFGHLGFPAMGIAGAAVATLVADIAGTAWSVGSAFSRKLPVRLSRRVFRSASLPRYGDVARVGVPAGLEEFLWNIGNLLLIRFLNEVDPLAAGIFTIVSSVGLIPAFVFIALGSASMTLSGRHTGAGEPHKVRHTVNRALLMSWAAASLFFALFVLTPGPLTRLFTPDPEVIARTPAMLLVSALAFFPRAANIVYGGGIRGTGDTRWMLMTQVFGTLFVLLAARYLIFHTPFGILGVFVAIALDELLRAVVNALRFYRVNAKVTVPR